MSGGFDEGRSARRGSDRLMVFVRLLLLSVFSTLMLAACGSGGGGTPQSSASGNEPTPTSAESSPVLLTAIAVTPTDPTLPKGLTEQFTAMGTYSDGTSRDISSLVTWSSDTISVAAVDTNGLASAVAVGSAVITAWQGDVSGSATLTVSGDTLTAIAVTPNSPTIPNGLNQQFTATGTYTNGISYDITKNVIWSSGTTTTATVDGSGLVTTLAVGSTAISADLDSVSGSTTLTVSAATLKTMTIAPNNPTIPKGQTLQFKVMGIYSDGTSHDITSAVQLSAGSDTIAASYYYNGTVYESGTIYGAGVGSTVITATLGPQSVYTTLTVTPATLQTVVVQPSNPVVYYGRTKQLVANGIYSDGTSQIVSSQVTWSSSDTTVATVDGTGLVTPVATAGSVDITVTLGSLSGTTTLTVTEPQLQSIEVTPTWVTIPNGLSRQFTATGHYSDGSSVDISSSVIWSSSSTSSLTVDNTGMVTAVGSYGSSTITATQGSISASTGAYVGQAVLQSIDVTPADPAIPQGLPKQFTATGVYSDGSKQDLTSSVTWSSDDTSVAAVNGSGLASTLGQGSAVISASAGGVAGKTTLTVGAVALYKIKVMPADPMVANGATQQFTATGLYSDGTSEDLSGSVTWHSGTSTVAGVDSNGLATVVGNGLGSSVITATKGSLSGSTTVTTSTMIATPPVVAFQGDTAHTGLVQWNKSLAFPTAPAWQVDLGGRVSDPLIVNGRVFVLVNAAEEQLVALDASTGSILWGPIAVDSSSYYSNYGGIAYDNGKLFMLTYSGVLTSFDAATGQAGWTTNLGQGSYYWSPVAANGIIVVKGSNGGPTAIDEDNGTTLWTGANNYGTTGTPAISGASVFITPPCEAVAYDLQTGDSLWDQKFNCSSGNSAPPVVGSNNTLFDLDSGQVHMLDTSSGQALGTFPSNYSPVVGTANAYIVVSNTLQSLTIANRQINWSFADANSNSLVTPPFAVDGTVFVASYNGTVYAVDATTGTQLWSGSTGTSISSNNGLMGLAAAYGYLVVPSSNELTAWKIVP